jgi:hypothetical protein
MQNMERFETFQYEELVKPSNLKTQKKMQTNSFFDELGLFRKLTTISRTSHRETPICNKLGRIKVCK